MENNTIYALLDYKGNFESKYNANPYRTGMDKKLLERYFSEYNFAVEFIPISEIINYPNNFWANKIIIYTSSEDMGNYYKSYIEDIIYYLELSKAKVIPSFKYLRANNNKVFMELLRYSFNNEQLRTISSKVFGSIEEMYKVLPLIAYPVIYKQATGAMSKGVGMANNQEELIRKIKKIARSKQLLNELWEIGRALKHKGYIIQSKFRNKFIIQNMVNGLSGDYKVLIFGNKYYVLKRDNRKDDFRASGSGIRNYVKEIPKGLLDYAKLCINSLNVSHASIDIAFNGHSFFLIEFQCLFFGSYTLTHSEYYWLNTSADVFNLIEGKSILEEEYVRSIMRFCT